MDQKPHRGNYPHPAAEGFAAIDQDYPQNGPFMYQYVMQHLGGGGGEGVLDFQGRKLNLLLRPGNVPC